MKELNEQAVRAAIDDCLSGVDALPSVRASVLTQVRGEVKVKKKFSAGIALAIVLMVLMMSVAVAAGLGLFGQLGEREDADARLPGLEAVSTAVGKTFTTEDGVTVTIDQAYYDGTRVFISYTKTGLFDVMTTGEGKPEVEKWDWELPGEKYGDSFGSDSPNDKLMREYLDGSEPRWAKTAYVNVHDGLQIGEEYLDIIGGDSYLTEDGTMVGWKECEVPAELAADEVTFLLGTFTSNTTYYQDENGLYVSFGPRAETTWHAFTVQKDKTGGQKLTGEAKGEDWTATAELTASAIDVKGSVKLTCPESWQTVWTTWENPDNVDYIHDWAFYVGGVQVEGYNLDGGVSGMEPLTFGICYKLDDMVQEMKLVPVYSQSGEHMDEAIVLTAE